MEAKRHIEEFIGEKIISTNPVGGGCIANSQVIKTESGKTHFLKSRVGIPDMFFCEASGLKELAKPNIIRIPKVILAHSSFLLLEFIEQGAKPVSFFEGFGRAFAKLHRFTSSGFGFFEDNYIGATPQLNIAVGNEKRSWDEFFFQKRLLPQLKLAEQNGYATSELNRAIDKLEKLLPKILNGAIEPPTLLHGDLWGGNYMCDKLGSVVLIDPAVYYGHREADMAMTKMFGGFAPEFYESYEREYPLPEGWEYRENIYLLYHYLNHLNLFGDSYYGQCVRLAKFYS